MKKENERLLASIAKLIEKSEALEDPHDITRKINRLTAQREKWRGLAQYYRSKLLEAQNTTKGKPLEKTA